MPASFCATAADASLIFLKLVLSVPGYNAAASAVVCSFVATCCAAVGVPVPLNTASASSSDKMKRRYVNKTRKAVEYFRDRHPKYKSLLKQLESIEAKWDKEGKHM